MDDTTPSTTTDISTSPAVEVLLPSEPPTGPETTALNHEAPSTVYDNLDYAAIIDAHGIVGMSPEELASIAPDVDRVVHGFGGVAFQEADALGNHPSVLRALGQLGADIRIGDAAESDYMRDLPQGTKVQVRELSGEALEHYIESRVLSRLDATTRSLIDSSGVLDTHDGQQFLANVAQKLYRHEHLLPALMGQKERLNTRRDQQRETAAVNQVRTEVAQLTDQEFESRTGMLWEQAMTAERAGNPEQAKALHAQRTRLFQARYPGR
jgi:hypothetical protein